MKKLITIVGLATLLGGLFFAVYKTSLQPVDSLSEDTVSVVVAAGSNESQIINQLKDADLINAEWSFGLYLRLNNLRGSLKSGTYELQKSMSSQDIADSLANGKVASKRVTILPGQSVSELKNFFTLQGFSEQEVESAFRNVKAKDYIKDVELDTLEGYLMPDTYILGKSASVEDFLILSLKQFEKVVTSEMRAGFAEQGLSVDEAVILASIVQKESSRPDNQVKIAQVFLTRLERGMLLGSDVTFYYAAKELGVAPDVNLDSPYNTRINKGLPPTAIGNFNLSAIESVANPSPTDYLFFVAGDDGVTYFSRTLQEHEDYVERYCIENCKL